MSRKAPKEGEDLNLLYLVDAILRGNETAEHIALQYVKDRAVRAVDLSEMAKERLRKRWKVAVR